MQKIIAANWKMYKTRQEARETAAAVAAALNEQPTPHEVVVFAPFTAIAEVADAFAASQAQAGAQDVWPAVEGAFTGEISPRMLQDAGAVWVLTGQQGLKVMLCIGEKLEERESGQLEDVLRRQLDSGLPAGGDALEGRFAVAYEPVWAIGTGKVAGPDEVLATHAVVRRLLCERLGETGNRIPILYGGSVKPANAGNLIGLDNVDGLLIGGASLDAQSFVQIIRA